MDALYKQLKFELQRFRVQKGEIETLFIGGGTPTTIDARLYEPIFKLIEPYLKQGIEITTEANPNSLTEDWIEKMSFMGVNRLSLGVQSFHEEKLKYLGRNHNQQKALKAIETAAKYVDNISIDLIYNVLENEREILQSDLDIVLKLPLQHISLYSLTIEDKTLFSSKKITNFDSLDNAQWLFHQIESLGFSQYEISNFGKKSQHNYGYWEYKDYIGAGAGAVGFFKDRRFYPYNDIAQYIQEPLYFHKELLTKEDILTEQILLGFRSSVGVDESILQQRQIDKLHYLIEDGKVSYKSKRFYNNNYLLADEIALYID